jgi:hypothetical protein
MVLSKYSDVQLDLSLALQSLGLLLHLAVNAFKTLKHFLVSDVFRGTDLYWEWNIDVVRVNQTLQK